MSSSLKDQLAASGLSAGNGAYVDSLYEQFLANPDAVSSAWRLVFRDLAGGGPPDVPHAPVREELATRAYGTPRRDAPLSSRAQTEAVAKQGAVSRMVQVYSNRGHLVANIDPLGLADRPTPRVLQLNYFGLSEQDYDTEFFTGAKSAAIAPRMKLRDIVAQLKFIYCGTIGAEFAHVSDSDERLWLQKTFQDRRLEHRFTVAERRNLLWQLTAAEGLERYLHTKYVGQKRFSLEGGDSLIAMLDDLIQYGGGQAVEECIIGMAHRGR